LLFGNDRTFHHLSFLSLTFLCPRISI
jgi:hypothetical protein